MQVPLDIYINQLVDGFDQFVSANPGFRTVFVQSRLIATTVAMNSAFYQELAQQFTVYCLTLGGSKPSPSGEGFSRFDGDMLAIIDSLDLACSGT